jgi:glycosyl transferase family 25
MVPLFTILISLTRSESRRSNAVETLKKLPLLDWRILEGIDGLKLQNTPPEYHESKVARLLGFPLTPSEIGCFLSHRQAWVQCIEKNRPTLILEDDFSIASNFEQALSALSHQYQDWDIARLQGLANTAHIDLISQPNYQIVINQEDPLGATGYIIKPFAAKKLLQHSNEIYEPLDHFLEHRSRHKQKIVAFKPYPIKANGTASTMHDRPNRHPITGFQKKWRSLNRTLDRLFNIDPWFPK